MLEVKKHLHQLIDATEDDELLNLIRDIIERRDDPGAIWNSLTDDQQEKVLKAEDSIGDKTKEIPHQQMIRRNKRWLK